MGVAATKRNADVQPGENLSVDRFVYELNAYGVLRRIRVKRSRILACALTELPTA